MSNYIEQKIARLLSVVTCAQWLVSSDVRVRIPSQKTNLIGGKKLSFKRGKILTLRSWVTPPSTDSSAEHEIFPVEVEATHVYRPASSGLMCWNTSASVSSSSLNKTLNRSSGSNSCPDLNQVKVGSSPGLTLRSWPRSRAKTSLASEISKKEI